MPARRWQLDRLADDIGLLSQRALPREQYFAEVSARLRRVLDADATCWHTLDPQTRMLTSDAPRELVEAGVYTAESAPVAGAGIIASEYLLPDFNTFGGLAARRTPVGILSQATKGRPERSTRYREVLVPDGIPHELRAAFVARGRAWGAVHIARWEEHGDFTAADAAALAHVVPVIADGIRTALRFDAAREGAGPAAPGMVVLGRHDEIELVTPPARELLASLRSDDVDPGSVPSALLSLAGFARVCAAEPAAPPAAVAVPTRSGWITLHASLPEGAAGGRVAIVLERSPSAEATAVRLETHGVTAREREVAVLLAQGLSNPEIAEGLVLSPYTVQDHIKSLFEKTGVSSRQELVGRIFLDDYLPGLTRRTPLSSAGRFV